MIKILLIHMHRSTRGEDLQAYMHTPYTPPRTNTPPPSHTSHTTQSPTASFFWYYCTIAFHNLRGAHPGPLFQAEFHGTRHEVTQLGPYRSWLASRTRLSKLDRHAAFLTRRLKWQGLRVAPRRRSKAIMGTQRC